MVVLDVEERGIIVRFADQVLFDLGEAELKPEFRTVLERFAQALRSMGPSNPSRRSHGQFANCDDEIPIELGIVGSPGNYGCAIPH